MYMKANYSYYDIIHNVCDSKDNDNNNKNKMSVPEQVGSDVPGDLPDVWEGGPPNLDEEGSTTVRAVKYSPLTL